MDVVTQVYISILIDLYNVLHCYLLSGEIYSFNGNTGNVPGIINFLQVFCFLILISSL